jgi:hypothetical protein
MVFYDTGTQTAGFRFVPLIDNGETSLTFGLLSPNAPAETLAQLYDSGATGGQVTVLSNGTPTSARAERRVGVRIGICHVRPALPHPPLAHAPTSSIG